jgi:hypothetical protein
MWLMYFLHVYKYGSLKPAESHFNKGGGGRWRIMEVMNQIGVRVHICGNFYSETPCTTIIYK